MSRRALYLPILCIDAYPYFLDVLDWSAVPWEVTEKFLPYPLLRLRTFCAKFSFIWEAKAVVTEPLL